MQVVKYYPNDILIKKIVEAANAYKNVCNKNLLYIALSQNPNNIFMFEAKYRPQHFTHLCGINSKIMNSVDFYENCINNPSLITIECCTPSGHHSRVDICEKISVLSDLLNLKNIKAFRSGEKMQGVGNIDFDFGVGDNCFIGYKYEPNRNICFPYTNMVAPISSYCIDPRRVSLVLSKPKELPLYNKVEYEVSKNLLSKLDSKILEAFSEFIDDDLFNTDKENGIKKE